MRVVSLLPGATEILAALGVAPVGVSHECDHPPRVADLPAVNRCRIDPDGSPDDVNEAVAEAAEGAGVYAVDRDRLAGIDPDLVVTQGVCDVCAVDQVSVRAAVEDRGLDCEVLTLDIHTLSDLYAAIEAVGTAVGAEAAAADLVADLRERVERVRERARDPDAGPRVAVLDWTDPVMVAGHWVPELVRIAGGRYDLEAVGADSRPREWAELREYDPAVLVVAPCGFDLAQTRATLDTLTERPGWADLAAVEAGRVHLMDGHHYVNRAGPRLVDTLEGLAGLVDPAEFEAPSADVAEPLLAGVEG